MHSAYAGEMWYIATVFFQPKTLAEALQHKADLRQGGIFIAGGTDLVVLMNHGKEAPEHLIDLSHIQSLTEIRPRDGLIELGGNVTFAQCARLPVQCLSQAALSVGGPGIREIGTLAGNLATASPAGDGSTALLALDAELELRTARGMRRLRLTDFFLDYRKTALRPDEMITKVFIPANYQTAWAKAGKRGAVNISVVAAAVALTPERGVRIALASVAPTPIRCNGAEEFLSITGLNRESILRATELVQVEVKPITDHRASADYKVHLSSVLVRRVLERLASL